MKIDITQYEKPQKISSGNKNSNSIKGLLSKDIFLFSEKLSDKKKEEFYTELHILLSAGVDIKSALELIENEQEKAKHRDFFGTIKSSVINGKTLSHSLQESKKFSLYEYSSIKIAEESGELIKVLQNLASYYTRKIKQKRQIANALSYPAIVLLSSLAALLFMIKFVVPVFADIFKQLNKELPFLTKVVLKLSVAFSNYWLAIVVFFIVVIGILFTQKSKIWYRKIVSQLLLKTPFLGILIKKIYLARFANAMNILSKAKMPITNSIELVSQMIHFYPIQTSLKEVKEKLIKGNSLYKSLLDYPIYPKRMLYLIKVAEEASQLESIFEKLSNQYADDVEHQTKLFLSLLEPLMIIILGVIVGVIFISMYLPLFQMSSGF